ncbi:MAG: 4Fe-4S binding protein, partial [Candidatus Heimdallarchaeota archaeon]
MDQDVISNNTKDRIVDSNGKIWRTPKSKIIKVADIMNESSIHPMQFSDDLYYAFDIAMTPEEIDFLLEMGGENHSFEQLVKKISFQEKDIKRILDNLVYKGQVAIIKDKKGNDVYHIMTIFPGWFELYLMRGEDREDTRIFAERIEELFESAYKVGNQELVNQSMRDVGAHIKVLSVNPPNTKTLKVDKKMPENENRIFATKSVSAIFDALDEDETIAAGHCFCRFEKELIGDHCRTDLPMDTCISIGPGAEHVIKQGIARQITKSEAIAMIKNFQDKGAIHQATRIIPLKDFQAKYPIDIFCNCCWDCCGILGNYNRGYLPYVLKTYHRAVVVNIDNCTSCGECVKFCPTSAIKLDDDELPVINDELCIGCGQCHHHCKDDVLDLVEEERDLFLPILPPDKCKIAPMVLDDDDDEVIDDSVTSDRAKVLKVLDETREKYTREDNIKTFKKWNKTVLYHFTDLDEYFHFTIKDGVPDAVKEGKIEKPDIFYTLSGTVFIGLMRGEINGIKAFRKKLVQVK